MSIVAMVRVYARAVLCMALMAWTATIALLYTASTRRAFIEPQSSDPLSHGDNDGTGIDPRPQPVHGQMRTIGNELRVPQIRDPIKVPDDTILVEFEILPLWRIALNKILDCRSPNRTAFLQSTHSTRAPISNVVDSKRARKRTRRINSIKAPVMRPPTIVMCPTREHRGICL